MAAQKRGTFWPPRRQGSHGAYHREGKEKEKRTTHSKGKKRGKQDPEKRRNPGPKTIFTKITKVQGPMTWGKN